MFRIGALALLSYNVAGCGLGEQFCTNSLALKEDYCTFGACVTCEDDPAWDGAYGNCVSYEDGNPSANHQYCVADNAFRDCPVACDVCDPADGTKAGEIGTLTDWSRWEPGSCPSGYELVTVVGANSYFETEPTHCMDGCVLVGNMNDFYSRFFTLTKDTDFQTAFYGSTESCVSRGWIYELGRVPKISTQYKFQTPGSEQNVQAQLYGVGYFSRDKPKGPGDGFDFTTGGCKPDSGFFFRTLPNEKETIDIGIIPKGKLDVYVKLKSDKDLDIQLYDTTATDEFDEGRAIVAWCAAPSSCNYGIEALMQTNTGGEVEYLSPNAGKTMKIAYSGFAPDPALENNGEEYIRITGETTVPLMLKAYSFEPGNVEVKYTWGGDVCCNGEVLCEGDFTRTMIEDDLVPIGNIPGGVSDFRVELFSDQDIDLQMYDQTIPSELHPEGEAIVGWCDSYKDPNCNFGYLSDHHNETLDYKGNVYSYSGYNGVDFKAGHEYIEISGVTQIPVGLAAFAYKDGTAIVHYYFMHQKQTRSGTRSAIGLTAEQLELNTHNRSRAEKRVEMPGRSLIEE